jgi:hypothetical protein
MQIRTSIGRRAMRMAAHRSPGSARRRATATVTWLPTISAVAVHLGVAMCHRNEVVRPVAGQLRPAADRQTELISADALPGGARDAGGEGGDRAVNDNAAQRGRGEGEDPAILIASINPAAPRAGGRRGTPRRRDARRRGQAGPRGGFLLGQVRICCRWPSAGTTSAGRAGRGPAGAGRAEAGRAGGSPVTAAAPRLASAPGRGP